MSNNMAYFDNAATTKISDNVLAAMMPYLTENYGNPSSIYRLGTESWRAVAEARAKVATAINCQPNEIFFTGSGSEANNWAIKGCMENEPQSAVITSAFEHHAVLHVVKKRDNITYLPVYDDGFVRLADFTRALENNPDTALVTIMHANNEIGTIQPIAEIGTICRERGVLFHTDAVQSVGNVHIDVQAMNVDMLSLTGHKFHAMKGVGALYVRKAVQRRLGSFIRGGAQESGKRAGTENVAGIVGLGVAIEEAVSDMERKNAKLLELRQRILNEVAHIPKARLNGAIESRLPNNLNFSFEGIEGEALLLQLDMSGICASSGSACTSGSLDPSHVLLALGLPHEIAHGSLRLTMSKYTTDEEVDLLLTKLPIIVAKLRAMSPMWEG
ncbi:MAG: aminotransferase class V-fold PLP-dependent enzyme [Oscillospiraceae bacterium]|nr:aminotransferase class V-fold PLP-dependent enzyme [Oscillospiraceae bacterium]